MPYYNDVPYYYGGGTYANHSSLMTGTGRTPFHTPLSRFSPHLSTISESPLNHLHRFSPISVSHTRRVINTADIDVSTPRILSHDGHRPRNRLRRDRPTIKIRSQALKDNPALREHHERHEKSVGELLMEKFFIKDKRTDDDSGQQVRLYHQVSLECNEPEEREAIQKQITRRFTRRRSSTDLQLDPEQLQREATYAQVQAKVLDNLVAEEQAHIENEARQGILIKKGTTTARGLNFGSYYANSADSDTMTKEEEEAAAARIRKASKKAKKKKKSIVDKLLPTDKIALDDRRSSTSSEMSTDSKIEDEKNSPRPQMYKIEACNSVGDFSTIWVNSNSEDSKKDHTTTLEQFRESIRVPIPRKFGTGSRTDNLSDSMNELETQVVLPVRKPYVKDPSRNSVYLTMRKPSEKLGEKLEELEKSDAKDDGSQISLANGFADAEDNVFKNINDTLTSKDEPELNSEKVTSDMKDAMLKKIEGQSEKMEHSTKKKEIYSTSNDDDSWSKRGTVILKTKNVTQDVGTKNVSSKNMEAAVNSIQSSLSAFVPTNAQKNNAQIKQNLELSKDVLITKKDETQRDKKKNLEPDSKIMGLVSKKDPVISKVDKVVDEEVSTNAEKNNVQIKQSSESSKDALVTNMKKDESQRNKKNLESSSKMLGLITKKDPIISKVDKVVDEKVSTNAQIKESESSKDALVTKKDESQRDKKNLESDLKSLRVISKKDPIISNIDKVVVEEVSTNAQIKQSESSKDAFVTKKDESEKKKKLEPSSKMVEVISKDPIISKIDKVVDEKEDGSKIPMMSHEDAIKLSVVTIKADGNEKSASSATLTPNGATCRLPKPSKINTDGNNTVEAPELSLRETVEYLANAKSVEDVVGAVDAALPRKKANKTTNLAKISSSDVAKKVSGVDAVKSTLKNNAARRDDTAKPDTKGTTLLKETKYEVSNDRDGEVTDFKSSKDINLTKTLKNNAESVLEPTSSSKLHESSPKLSSPIEAEVIAAKPAPADSSLEAKQFKNEIMKISSVDAEKDSKNSDLSNLKSKAKLNGVESKFPVKIKTFPKKEVNETKAVSGADSSKIKEDLGTFKITKVDDSKQIVPPKKDTDAAKILKKGTSIDSPKSKLTSNNENFPKIVPKPSASVDDKVEDKISPVKKTLEPAKFPNKMMNKKPVTVSVSCEKPQEESGQLSKSTSTESIDFWSEIKAPGSPEVTRPKQQMTIAPKVEDPASPKWISSDPMMKGKSSTVSVEEFDGKKNETNVKINATPGSSAVGSSDVGAEEEKENVVPESPKVKKAEISKPTTLTVQKAPLKKKKNLSIAIGVKELNSTVKKAPLKRDDSGDSKTVTPIDSEVSTPVSEVTVPTINIVKAPKLPEEFERQSVDEEYEDPKTPTNELPPDSSLITKISRWSNQDDLTNVDEVETPVASEEASLAATPSVSPQSSKTKRIIKKKKGSSKKTSSVKSDKGIKEARGNELTTTMNQQNKLTVKSAPEKQLLVTPSPKPSPKTSPKTSPRSSPRNTPSQRPLDLIRMFYTTPSALLTATPRDLSKVKRAKIKRRRHHSRTPSVSSDSTGSTTSTATTESTDGSTCTELDDEPEHKRMNSTRSNDSGFDGSPRISSTYFLQLSEHQNHCPDSFEISLSAANRSEMLFL